MCAWHLLGWLAIVEPGSEEKHIACAISRLIRGIRQDKRNAVGIEKRLPLTHIYNRSQILRLIGPVIAHLMSSWDVGF